ncbi:shikimate kinase AroL [Maridesulfovibrio sp. FT414]
MSNIYLIGPRACGKTTVGKLLAGYLKCDFYDSDAVLVERAGCDIAEYVARNGWDGFRDLEVAVLADLSGVENAVISCGGGIVVRDENFAVLRNGFTVYIKADVEVLAARLEADPAHGQRPSLTGKPLVEEIRDVLEAREDLYKGCASFIADGAAPVETVCEQILTSYRSFELEEK